MIERNFDMRKWRAEAVDQYRSFLNSLDPSSEEYRLVKKGIEDFEKIPL